MRIYLMKLLIFFIFVCGLLPQNYAGTKCTKAINTIIESTNKFQSSDDAINDKTIAATIAKFNQLTHDKISPPKSHDFELLQKDTRRLALSLMDLAERFDSQQDSLDYIISLCNVYFKIIDEVQAQIQIGFDKFHWQDRLANMIPFVQSRTALDHARATLLSMTTNAYSKLNNPGDKISFWAIVSQMVDSTQIVVTEIGPVQSEFHTLVILLKLIKITENLGSIYLYESDEAVKSISEEIMKIILTKQQQFKEQVEEVKRKGREFARYLATAEDYAGIKKRVNYREIKRGLTANEWFQKGYRSEDCHEKIKYFTKAIEIEPTFLPAYINRGVCYDNLSLFEKAIADYTRALKIKPRYALVLNYRGMSYNSLGRYEEALRDFNAAIEYNPQLTAAFINRGVLYRQSGNFARAVQDYSQAILLDPYNAQIYSRRGTCFTHLKKFNQAVQDFLKAIEISPDYMLAYYNLGYAYWELKKWQEVVKAWEKCLELKPQQEELRKHLKYAKRYARYERLKKSIK